MTLPNSYHHSWCINNISRSSWSAIIIYWWCESLLYRSITPLIEYDTKSIAPNIGISFGIITRSSIYWISYIPDDAKYFLLSQNGQAVEDRGHSQEAVGQKMIVNFWSNSHANELLGLGDLLPNNVLSVEVNGKIGTLKASPRPGYYTDKWLYLSVYNESIIKILKIWNPKADFLKDLESQWQKRQH